MQVLRVQSPEGTRRIDIGAGDTAKKLFEKIYDVFELNSFAFGLYKQRNNKDEIVSTGSKTVAGLGLSHGDMLYLVPVNGTILSNKTTGSSENSVTPSKFNIVHKIL